MSLLSLLSLEVGHEGHVGRVREELFCVFILADEVPKAVTP